MQKITYLGFEPPRKRPNSKGMPFSLSPLPRLDGRPPFIVHFYLFWDLVLILHMVKFRPIWVLYPLVDQVLYRVPNFFDVEFHIVPIRTPLHLVPSAQLRSAPSIWLFPTLLPNMNMSTLAQHCGLSWLCMLPEKWGVPNSPLSCAHLTQSKIIFRPKTA